MELVIPGFDFLVAGYVGGLLAGALTVAALRSGFRVGSVANWIFLVPLLPVPILAAVPLTSLAYLPTSAALPSVGMAIVVGVLIVHWLLPALLPDFQTNSLSASALLALVLGLVVLIAGLLTGEFPDGLLTEPMDPFAGEGPGLQEFEVPR